MINKYKQLTAQTQSLLEDYVKHDCLSLADKLATSYGLLTDAYWKMYKDTDSEPEMTDDDKKNTIAYRQQVYSVIELKHNLLVSKYRILIGLIRDL